MALVAAVAIGGSALAQPTAQRGVEPVVVKGVKVAGWSGPPAEIVCDAYPSGGFTGTRNAHGGTFLPTPPATGVPVDEIAAYRWDGSQFTEIPVQVDQMYPYCLANPNSDFGIYSGTDLELTYAWDVESWKMTSGTCSKEYAAGDGPVPDPVPTLDDDDEIVFMASDAGSQAPVGATEPAGATDSQAIVITDPLDPATLRYVYLFRKPGGSSFDVSNGYVAYVRDANADEYIDRYSFPSGDPEQLGSSNTGYGPNLDGDVCVPLPQHNSAADDRFPRDGVTISTGSYKWHASGRWMVRSLQVADAGSADRARLRRGLRVTGVRRRSRRPLEGSRVPAEPRLHHLARRLRGRAGELGGQLLAARRAYGSRARHPRDLGRGFGHQRHQDRELLPRRDRLPLSRPRAPDSARRALHVVGLQRHGGGEVLQRRHLGDGSRRGRHRRGQRRPG
jgi:hypothetical protein